MELAAGDRVIVNFGQSHTFVDTATGRWRLGNLANGRYVLSVDSQTADFGYVDSSD